MSEPAFAEGSAGGELDAGALSRKATRERKARLEAEGIAERATRELYDRHRDLELLEAIARASNAASDIDSPLQVTVDAVCGHTGWPVGHVYMRSADGERLEPTAIWHLDDEERFADFKRATEEFTPAVGVGLPGRTLEAGVPIWIPDAEADENFPRIRVAEATGIRAAFAFPILIEDAVVGVVEFFSPSVLEPDEGMLDLVGQVGVHLGRVIERDRHVTEMARRADELERSATELEAANDELKEFAYVASHDLSEPLRTISGFVQLLRRRYAEELDETAGEYIDFVVEGTERMQALIDDLLSYSRAGRSEIDHARVDLNDCARRARATISASAAGASIEIEDLPTVVGDAGELDRLFENLLSNAVKFRADAPPEVRVGAEPREGEWELHVADNGIGIADRHRERIFQVFQRLHGAGDYPGTGVGLSICKRVVERHGGRIWADETAGGGTTFRFTLPAPADEKKS